MKRTLATALLILASACAGTLYKPAYDMRLESVERPANATQRYGPVVVSVVGDSSVFEDGMIRLAAVVGFSQVGLLIQNKSEHAVRVKWSEAAFVGFDGQASPIMHDGTRYIECKEEKAASVIPRGASLTDFVVPCSHVFYREAAFAVAPGWVSRPILVDTLAAAADTAKVGQFAREKVGRRLQLLVPIEIQGTTNEYVLNFIMRDAKMVPYSCPAIGTNCKRIQ